MTTPALILLINGMLGLTPVPPAPVFPHGTYVVSAPIAPAQPVSFVNISAPIAPKKPVLLAHAVIAPQPPPANAVVYKPGDESGISYWTESTSPNPKGGYDYYCNYTYANGTTGRTYRMTAPTNDQGITCKP